MKDTFHEQLQSELESIPGHETKIVMGVMNAEVGNDNTCYEGGMGREGCSSVNDNGERLLECCITYHLVSNGTLFAHPDIHKIYPVFPKRQQQNNPMDHIVESCKMAE